MQERLVLLLSEYSGSPAVADDRSCIRPVEAYWLGKLYCFIYLYATNFFVKFRQHNEYDRHYAHSI